MESFAADLATMVRRPLADEHVARMRRVGQIVHAEKGEMVQAPGEATDLFHFVLA